MSLPIVLCLANLALIGALPRVFFRRGRLNARWWLTAAPFLVAAALLLCGLCGVVEPLLRMPVVLRAAAVALDAASIALIGYTLRSHRQPVSLWHQDRDAPACLVTGGAYARVRHPFYLAFLLSLLASVLAFPHGGTVAAALFAGLQLNRTAAGEERRLLASAFASEYATYRSRTGRFLPRLSPAGRRVADGSGST